MAVRLQGGARCITGRGWEDELLNAARWAHGLCLLRTAPDERTGRGAGVPDLMGAWKGRAVAVEAKETAEGRWPLNKLRPAQHQVLCDLHVAGALVLLAVRVGGSGLILPWPDVVRRLRAWEAGGDASITAVNTPVGRLWRGQWTPELLGLP